MHSRYLTTAALRALEAQLTDRDRAVLKHVSDLRFVSGSQLTRLCFAGSGDPVIDSRAARRTLLRLVRLGVLIRLPRVVGGVRSGSAGYVYRLANGGQRLAIAHGWQSEGRRRRSLTPGSLFVAHALQVAELHTGLIEGERSGHFELLELRAEPSCWRKLDGLGTQRQMLKPDSYVRLGIGPYEDSYFLEVDRGTEGSRALERQLQLYVAYHLSGEEQTKREVFPRVLWLVPDEQRKAALVDSLARLPAEQGELFQVARFDEAIDRMLASSDNNSPKLPSDAPW
jgi:hypothetical protein